MTTPKHKTIAGRPALLTTEIDHEQRKGLA